jgi:HpcH/HpaI aldolase/citrate lyase family
MRTEAGRSLLPDRAEADTAASTIELMLFEHDATCALEFVEAGLRSFLVDWEHLGKDARQQGFDTEIRLGTVDELRAMCTVPDATVWCRINRFGPHTGSEIAAAIDAGADGVFLPMVTACAEVESLLRILDGQCEAGILVETTDALAHVEQLATFPLDRVYFGLNDFAISRGGGSIFRAVLDGSVERARIAFGSTRFGFGGLTAVDAGDPVPCRMLIEELARVRCDFTFLRRSFRRDLATRRLPDVLTGIRTAWHASVRRDLAIVAGDHLHLQRILSELA